MIFLLVSPMCINISVVTYQECQTPQIPPIVCSLQRIELKSNLDSGDTTGSVKSFLFFFFSLCTACTPDFRVRWADGSYFSQLPFHTFSKLSMKKNEKKTILTKQCWKHLKALCIRKQNSQFKRWHCPLSTLWIGCPSVAEMLRDAWSDIFRMRSKTQH